MIRQENDPMFMQTSYQSVTYNIAAGNTDAFGLSFGYLVIESIQDAAGVDLPSIEISINMKTTVLKAGIKLTFNKLVNDMRFKNTNGVEAIVTFGYGVGNMEDYRLFISGGLAVTTTPDWAPAYSDTILASANAGNDTLRDEAKNLVSSGATVYVTVEGGSIINRRLLYAELVETSGIPNAFIAIVGSNQSWTGAGIFSCQSGQVAQLPRPLYMNAANANRIYAAFYNGATGYCRTVYENIAASGSGAR